MIEILAAVSSILPLLIFFLIFLDWKFEINQLTLRLGKIFLVGILLLTISNMILFYTNPLYPLSTLGGLLRFDPLSVIMFFMVSIIGLIILRFSESYLQGDPNHQGFIRKLLLTIAFVQLLVLSGNLFFLWFSWAATSFSLQRLIYFYKDRREAQQAVKKKFLIARMSDFTLLVAVILLYLEFGSSNLEVIFTELKGMTSIDSSWRLEIAAIFLVLAAMIKSVQIPFHGWILDVMEAPTPVSGLLHAGLLNAGPFLIIRFAFLMEISTIAPVVLLIIAGASALYGTLVFPTQPAIKTSLAYSSIGHMGFSLMICGLGLYSASLLHLVAHSFYKAHSFLSSGSVIDKYRLKQLNGHQTFNVNVGQFLIGIAIVSSLFILIVNLFNSSIIEEFQMMVLASIILTGVASFGIKTATFKNGFFNLGRALMMAGAVITAFFLFEGAIAALLGNQIPTVSEPGMVIKSISLTLFILFTAIIFYSLFKKSSSGNIITKWDVYKRNGFYIHIVFDRLVKSIHSKIKSQDY